MKKIFNSKILSVIVLIVAICALLTSCMGGASTAKIEKAVSNYDGSVNTLKQEQLNTIATTIYNNPEAKNAFFAAFRGYDVIDGQDTDYSENKGPNYTFIAKVINNSRFARVWNS